MSADETEILASAWVAREDRGLTPEEAVALAQWRQQSALHQVSYLRMKATWNRVGRLAALKGPARSGSQRPVWFDARKAAIAAGLLVTVMCAGTYLAYRLTASQVYATQIGQTQAVRLSDGTRMELNTNTRIHADVTQTQRTVTLDSGEAYFEVVHDAARPFVVYAGTRRITDLGTKFSVFRNGDDVRVMVKEGRVRVDVVGAASAVAPVLAGAGRMVIAHEGETLIMAKPPQAIVDDLSWRTGTLVFRERTLADAAEEFNRYNAKKILVEGSARRIRIGGSFRADNVDVFVLLLHQGFGLSVNDNGGNVVVSR
jgi:transmembrane sensor